MSYLLIDFLEFARKYRILATYLNDKQYICSQQTHSTMKQILTTAALLLAVAICATAQSNAYEKAVKAINETHKTSSVTISKEVMDLTTYFALDAKEELTDLIDGLDKLIIVTVKQEDANNFYPDAQQAFIDKDYEQLDVSDYVAQNKAVVYVEKGLLTVSEAHLIVNRERGCVVSFFGKFKAKEIKKLIKASNYEK